MKKKFQAVKQKNNGKKKTILTRAELVRVHRKDTLFSIAVFSSSATAIRIPCPDNCRIRSRSKVVFPKPGGERINVFFTPPWQSTWPMTGYC